MYQNILLFGIGTTEVVVTVLIVLLLFGGRKIPELMRGLGSGIKEFNKAKNDVTESIKDGMKEPNEGE